MQFPKRFSDLPEYAFPRLRALLADHPAGGPEIAMSIGEPKHPFPDFVADIIAKNAASFGRYPPNDGTPELRMAISDWLLRRYGVKRDPDADIIALNGTREGLFNACIALCPEEKFGRIPNVLIPNPFYQVYAVAAATANAHPVFVSACKNDGFLPNFNMLDTDVLDNTAIAYLCSPSNPQGAVASADYWANLIRLAEKHDFRIFADECYSEIYRDTPPPGALEIADKIGADKERVLSFHSLSKRSNLPGLRSGFAAGGPDTIASLKQLRAYAGAPLPLPLQRAAEAVWADEAHVAASRALYQKKYQIADRIFSGVAGYVAPEAGFFLWLPVDDGEAATIRIWSKTGVKVLPGAYLSRGDSTGVNPGQNYIRVALVAPIDELQRGLQAIRDCIY